MLYGQIIKNLQWLNVDEEITELSIGKGVTLYAETETIKDGEEVTITIWSKGDGDDLLVGKYVSRVYDNKIAFHWILAFDWDSHSYEIETKGFVSPLYYFEIRYNAMKSKNSELLAVRVWLKHGFYDSGTGEFYKDRGITILLPDDTEIVTRTDTEGRISIDNVKVIGMVAWFIHRETNEKHEIIQPYQEPNKPIYYKIKDDDENLRKIAGYDFIYGDPDLWRKLYEANRHNFIDDRNPDSIEIGQALFVPPIGNEIREGTR
jgi:hypothetical protein